MSSVDRFFDDMGLLSARYVDDMYIFAESVDQADHVLRKLIPFLRSYDLHLNEVKSIVMPKSSLFAEEPDLELLFSRAVEEISDQLEQGALIPIMDFNESGMTRATKKMKVTKLRSLS